MDAIERKWAFYLNWIKNCEHFNSYKEKLNFEKTQFFIIFEDSNAHNFFVK